MPNKFKDIFFKLCMRWGTFYLQGEKRYKLVFSSVFTAHPDETVLKHAFDFVAHNNIEGDYLEFGVWKGRSFSRAFRIWKYVRANTKKLEHMNFYAFDSFQGLPEMSTVEDSSKEFSKGQYYCSIEDFKKNMAAGSIDMNRVKLVPGWYDEVLNATTKKQLPLRKGAIIFIDCDLYSSAVTVLDFITDYITDGTILIFDDWFCFKGAPDKGERKAFADWIKKNPSFSYSEFSRFNWRGNSFIIHRK